MIKTELIVLEQVLLKYTKYRFPLDVSFSKMSIKTPQTNPLGQDMDVL